MSLKASSVIGYSRGIKNNLEGPTEHFSWKIAFPHSVSVKNIQKNNVMIVDSDFNRLECEMEYNPKGNFVLISPINKYEINRDYFFVVTKYTYHSNAKDICIAFILNDDNELKTYSANQSTEKFSTARRKFEAENHKYVAQRTAMAQSAAAPKEYLNKLHFKYNYLFLFISVITILIEFFIESSYDPVLFTRGNTQIHLTMYSVEVAVYTVTICSIAQVIVWIRQSRSRRYKSLMLYNQGTAYYNANRYAQALNFFEQAEELYDKSIAYTKSIMLCKKQLESLQESKAQMQVDSLDKLEFQFNVAPLIVSNVFNFLLVLFVHILEVSWGPAAYLWELFWICIGLQIIIFIIQFVGGFRKSILHYNRGVVLYNDEEYEASKSHFEAAYRVNKRNLSAKSALEILAGL